MGILGSSYSNSLEELLLLPRVEDIFGREDFDNVANPTFTKLSILQSVLSEVIPRLFDIGVITAQAKMNLNARQHQIYVENVKCSLTI